MMTLAHGNVMFGIIQCLEVNRGSLTTLSGTCNQRNRAMESSEDRANILRLPYSSLRGIR